MIFQWVFDRMAGRGINDDLARRAEGAAQNVETEARALHEDSIRDPLQWLIDDLRRWNGHAR